MQTVAHCEVSSPRVTAVGCLQVVCAHSQAKQSYEFCVLASWWNP